MKTAMKELIEHYSSMELNEFKVWFLNNAKNLYEKEKKQIIDAHLDGMDKLATALNEFVAIKNTMLQIEKIKNGTEKHDNGEKYYKQTYNQDSLLISEIKMSEEEIRDWHMIQSLKEKYGE
jgi:hypothetical protein